MKGSNIGWTENTFNPWIGCMHCSPGCDNCYAEGLMDTRYGRAKWGQDGTRSLTSEATWSEPLRWNEQAFRENRRIRVFCASLADVFEAWPGPMLDHQGAADISTMATWRKRLFALIAATPLLDWQLLTKRPQMAARFFAETTPSDIYVAAQEWEREFQPAGKKRGLASRVATRLRIGEVDTFKRLRVPSAWPFPNVWMGTSVENQRCAETRIPWLLRIPAVVRFLSCEPLLGEVDLMTYLDPIDGGYLGHSFIDWVICGGESGADRNKVRPMHPEWAASLRDQCLESGVPFFFKQWGSWGPTDMAFPNLCLPDACSADRIAFTKFVRDGRKVAFPVDWMGKEKAGRLLEGEEWSEFPEVQR